MHIQRANYQAMIWNNSLERYPEIPSPVGHGWVLDESGKLNYDWTKGDIMPQELVDIICETELGEEREVSDDNEDSDNEDGYYDETETDNVEIDKMVDISAKLMRSQTCFLEFSEIIRLSINWLLNCQQKYLARDLSLCIKTTFKTALTSTNCQRFGLQFRNRCLY